MKPQLLKKNIVLICLLLLSSLIAHATDKIVSITGDATHSGTYLYQGTHTSNCGTTRTYTYYKLSGTNFYLYADYDNMGCTDDWFGWYICNGLIANPGQASGHEFIYNGYMSDYSLVPDNPGGCNAWINLAGGNVTSNFSITDAASGTAPTVSTLEASLVTTTSGTIGGNVLADGGASVTARGLVFSPSSNTNPQIGGTNVTQYPVGTGTGSYTQLVSSLTAGATYYYQAYGTNSYGTNYGGVKSFTTPTTSQPNKLVSGITSPSAANGVYVWIGNYYGKPAWKHQTLNYWVYYSRLGTYNPTAHDWYIDGQLRDEHGTGDYYFYHSDVATCPASGWTSGSGNGTGTGTPAITDYPNISFTNGTSFSPANPLANTTNNPIGRFYLSGELAGASLTAVTINAAGTRSGVSNLKLWSSSSATFSTGSATQLNSQSNGATVTFSGISSSISTSGTYYFITTDLAATASGSFTLTIASQANLTISGGAIASSFSNAALTSGAITIISLPTITTTAASPIATTSATMGGNVTADGGATISERGVVYALSSANTNPQIGGSGVTKVAYSSGGTGSFSQPVSSLSQGTSYHYNAYAINSAGTNYGNVNSFTTQNTVSSIVRVGSTLTNAISVSWTVTFAASVTGLTSANFSLANTGLTSPSISSVTGSGTTWTVTANTGNGSGSLGLNLANATGLNSGLSNTLPYAGEIYSIDKTAPSAPTITGLSAGYFNTNQTFTVSGEAGATLEYSTNNGGLWTAYSSAVTLSAEGTYSVLARQTDQVGNGPTSSGVITLTIDKTAPTVTITSTATNPTNASPIPVMITFSESVSGFAVGDIVVTNGTKGAINGGPAVYTIDITPSGQGAVTVNVAAGVATDAAGNANTAATQLSRTYDNITPTVTLTSTTSEPTKTSTIPVTITFSEVVTGFDASGITVTNGTKGTLSGSGASYTIDITPSDQGAVTVDIAAGVATDDAGNSNTAATQLSRTFDNRSPYIAISSVISEPTNASPFTVYFAFDEPVTGFDASDITVTNGTKGTFTIYSSTIYYIDITPSGQGVVTVNVADGVATDAAGNANTAATEFSRTFDNIAPTVTLTSSASEPTKTSPIPVTITFSKSVTGFDASDITVTNGTKGTLSGSGASYSIDITPSGQGVVTVNVAGGVATDAAGNGNTAATQLSRTFDNVSPSVTISSSASETTNVSPIPVTIIFSEAITGFDASDITVTNGTKGTLSGSGSSYTINITPVSQGAVTIAIAAGVATDAAGNGNAAATSLTRTYNTVSPLVTLTSSTSSLTNASPIPVTITFSEAVTGFDASDVTVTNGTKGTFSGSGASYSIDITPLAQGTVTVAVEAGVATSLGGNANAAATSLTRTYDIQGPLVTLSSTTSEPTNASPIPVTITFSEPVTGFDASDITVTNGTKGTLSGSGASYIIDITPSAQGAVTVDVAAGVATDAAGNSNSSATQFSRIYDSQAPSVAVTSSVQDPTNANPIPLNIVFTEAITGFTSSDIKVNGTVSNLQTTDNIHWTADIIPNGMGAVGITIEAGKVQDLAGNGNTASDYLQRTYDPKEPTVTLSSTSPNPTRDNPVVVKITFSEIVWHFDLNDIVVTNGTASNLQMSDYHENWTVDIYPASDGMVKVDIPAGAAQDYANNNNKAATQFSRTCDITSPTVAMTSVSASATKDSPIPVSIVFSEPVSGFDETDVTVVNGTIVSFGGAGSAYTMDIVPSAQGLVTVDIGANVAQDAIGNGNTAATQFSRMYDTQAPSVTLSSTTASLTNVSPVPVTIKFSEPVTGFDAGDISVTNGTLGSFSGSGDTYSVNITPSGQGMVLVNVAAGVTADAAGNTNTASSTLSRTFDNLAPTVSIASNASEPINTSPIPVTITFSESVTDFAIGDITVTNGTVSNLSGSGTIYAADITPSAQGVVTVNIASGVAQDAAGNGNTTATQLSRTYDTKAPTVSISSTASKITNVSPIPVTITFSESVTGFAVGDITVTNGTAENFSGSGTTYTADITPSGEGSINVGITGSVAQDAAGNNNTAATQWSIIYTTDYIISGNAGTAGVALSYTDGTPKTVLADVNGEYYIVVPVGWSGTITPSKTGYTLSADKVYANVLANQTSQDYTATAITYTISGNVGVGGATLSYTNGSAKTAMADNSGNYSFTVSYNWSGTVAASKTGYTFSAGKVYTNVLSNQASQDYTATAITYVISGNAGVAGAILSYTDGSVKTTTADGSGNYTFTVSYNWSGTVSASKTGYTFSADKVYTNVLSDQTVQDYIATVITDTRSIKESTQIIVYPTVNDGTFRLNIQSPENGKVMVKIFNLQGVTVDKFQFSKSLSSETFDVIMSRATIGMYTVEISANGHKTLQKVLVK